MIIPVGMRTLVLGAVLFLAPLALAANPKQVSMPVGHTTTLSMPSPVSQVTVDDPGLVEVTKQGRKVVFTGVSKGATEVTVKTAEGDIRFRVYVAADKYAMPH